MEHTIKNNIDFNEFLSIQEKLDIRVGLILSCERVPKSKKLVKLSVLFESDDIKTVVTNLGEKFEPEVFVNEKALFVVNLVPSTMMGITSEAMILAAESIYSKDRVSFSLNDYLVGSKVL